jgi:hypothetical protein
MSYGSNAPQSGGALPPLSIGNVVSAAFRLYSSHLKPYLTQSVIAHLWVLLPIYGWAKYAAKTGLISRLAFGELSNQPEGVGEAHPKTDRAKWSFLGVLIRVGLWMFVAYLVFALLAGIVGGLLAVILRSILGAQATQAPGIFLVSFLIIIGAIAGVTWIYSRFVIAEVPLAVEEGLNSKKSVDRSWSLTKASVFRIQGVVLVGFLITLPILFLFNYLPQIGMLATPEGSALYWTLYTVSLLTSLVGNVFVMPFWQALKAVLYYDLRSRREGLDLNLRDR